VEKSLCNRLEACRKTDYRMTMNVTGPGTRFIVVVVIIIIIIITY
jgi:hypothetical protein